MSLKNMSIKEMKYKLISKGTNANIVDDYFNENYDELLEFEQKSAQNIYLKKCKTMEKQEIKMYLMKKGYKQESIKGIT